MVQHEGRRSLGSRYELLERLGSGAMGEVWRAVDRTTGAPVAAKLLREAYSYDTEIVTRFVRERSILLNLRHPRIVQVRDLVVEGDQLGIVMDLVEGRDLRAHLKEVRTVPAAEAVAVTCEVLDAIAAAHAAGVLHRDIKPDNVLLVGGVPGDGTGVRLSDFGIARLAHDSTVQSTGLIGTPGYMPPELFQYGRFSQASDVYAVGILLYELLGGRTPFAGKGTVHTIGNRHVTVDPPRLPVHPLLWTVIAIMLAKDPSTRLSAAATAQALRDLPVEAFDAPALPPQGEPESWDTAQRTVVRPHAASPAVGGAGDAVAPGGTEPKPFAAPFAAYAPEAPRETPPVPAPPPAASTEPSAAPSPEAAPGGRHALPARAGTDPAPTDPARRRLWIAAAVAAVAAVVIAVSAFALLPGGSDDPDPTAAVSELRADLPLQRVGTPPTTSPSGLVVSRSAVYDPAATRVDVDLAVTPPTATGAAATAGVAVSVLVFLPGSAEEPGTCPSDVTWEGATAQRVSANSSGVQQACGWSVSVPSQSRTVQVTAGVVVDLGTTDAALESWEDASEQLLAAAVADTTNTNLVFPAQRVEGVALLVQPTTLGQQQRAGVTVQAEHPGGSTAIFSSGAQASPELLQLTGGTLPRLDACDALEVTAGQALYARFASTGCDVVAEVGRFAAPPVRVTITGLSS
ncbi:protein kinase [Nocardioides zeae]|uniref:non-specific serine/threonine protein kinase n=1 Tax=Nocardioides imazamoxiresistens TaxID=3231893 RepID=A0ABU3PYN4_9ACTN|nr:protein kinase [Nocardioides zeae]MDT9594380.1 protein kinase [Nocardioides zeae]